MRTREFLMVFVWVAGLLAAAWWMVVVIASLGMAP